ncbi:hypothetical protein A2U01_0062825, partial [Trifolium medium]|nr:hypothetical protein [Trifolium medium]
RVEKAPTLLMIVGQISGSGSTAEVMEAESTVMEAELTVMV